MIERLCKNCNTAFAQYNTAQTLCQKCAYNKYSKPHKPIKKVGKKTKLWFEFRRRWIESHPPDENGYWQCYLKIHPRCLGQMDIDQLTLDHVIARSSVNGIALQYNEENILPACIFCNGKKGSQTLEALGLSIEA